MGNKECLGGAISENQVFDGQKLAKKYKASPVLKQASECIPPQRRGGPG